MTRRNTLARFLLVLPAILASGTQAADFRVPLPGLLTAPPPGVDYLSSAYNLQVRFRRIALVQIELTVADWYLGGASTGNSSWSRWVYGGVHDLTDPVDLNQFNVSNVGGLIETGDPSTKMAHGVWWWYDYGAVTLVSGFSGTLPDFLYSGRGKAVLQQVNFIDFHPMGGDPSTFTHQEFRLSPPPATSAYMVIVGTPTPEPTASALAHFAAAWGIAYATRREIAARRI